MTHISCIYNITFLVSFITNIKLTYFNNINLNINILFVFIK